MKRIFICLFFFVVGCKSELDNRYLNPDKTTSTSIDKLFTGMLANDRVWPKYWEMSTFINWHIGIYTQSVGFLNSSTVYQQNESYIQDRWNDFYRPSSNGAGVMALYRQMESIYKTLDAPYQQQADVFMNAARVVLYDQATQMVDLWGDIPFSEAGSLQSSGSLTYPKFDDAKSIYADAIQQLKTAADYFASASLDVNVQSTFQLQDILLGGSLDRWRRYANSLRLRLLMRISSVDEATAKPEVIAMLADPSRYPLLVEENYSPAHHDVLLAPVTTNTDDLHAAFADWTNYPAPYYALEKVLKPAGDLRIPVLYDKYGATINNQFVQNSDYSAMPLDLSRTDQQAELSQFAVIDSTTFLYNSKLPGMVMTVSEVNFLRAEAFERWGGGNAEDEYLKGIRHSIIFYYYLNNLNPVRSITAPPSSSQIDQFLSTSSTIQYSSDQPGRLQQIAAQKWVHFGVLQSVQSWAERRRTSFPALTFTPSASPYDQPPNRLTYPQSEKSYNPNYTQVADKDTRSAIVFWDPF